VKGYKTGGFNTRASTIDRFNAGFGEETLWSYEVGVKSQLLDNRVRFNVAAFTSKYRDIQINVQSDPSNIRLTDVLNAGRATVKGIEADLTVVPAKGLRLTANYGYLDAKYDKIIDASGTDVSSQFRFVNAPKHSYSLDATYTSPNLGFGAIEANVNYAWQQKRYSSSNLSGGTYIIGSYGLLNARLSLVDIPVAKSLRVGVFGRNLLDKEYYIAHFNVGVPGAIFGEPRTYGVDLTAEF
jgi:iron complex outermembrane receptor protein